MTRKDFEKLLKRDSYCLHCGETEALSPNHRANRGMGGSKLRDTPSNLVLLCSSLNSLIESDTKHAEMALSLGWKVSTFDDWRIKPVKDTLTGKWYLLRDDWSRVLVEGN